MNWLIQTWFCSAKFCPCIFCSPCACFWRCSLSETSRTVRIPRRMLSRAHFCICFGCLFSWIIRAAGRMLSLAHFCICFHLPCSATSCSRHVLIFWFRPRCSILLSSVLFVLLCSLTASSGNVKSDLPNCNCMLNRRTRSVLAHQVFVLQRWNSNNIFFVLSLNGLLCWTLTDDRIRTLPLSLLGCLLSCWSERRHRRHSVGHEDEHLNCPARSSLVVLRAPVDELLAFVLRAPVDELSSQLLFSGRWASLNSEIRTLTHHLQSANSNDSVVRLTPKH